MLETRRELFRTSVTAALSFSVGAVAGYAAAETFLAPQAAAAGSAGSVVAVHDTTAKVWYLFHFESDQSNCRLYSANCVPALANTSAVDTATWFAVACKKVIKTTTVISYTQSNGSPGSISVSFANGYLDLTSLTNLLNLLPGTAPPQIPASWNEIGKA